MKNLTPEQHNALAHFKRSIHLPNGGYHTLIVELCRKYNLPFQSVRSVLKKTQSTIENRICRSLEPINEADFTKDHWLNEIHQSLKPLADAKKSVMDSLMSNEIYTSLVDAQKKTAFDDQDREQALNDIDTLYELEVYKPLQSMLYTTSIYWSLKSELCDMTEIQCERFHEYPQYMKAIEHLHTLRQAILKK